MAYPSYAVTNTFSAGTDALASEINTNFTEIETTVNGASAVGTPAVIGMVPIGSIVAWAKTLGTVDSGTADTNTLNALEDSGGDFVNAGVVSGMVVFNSTDGTFAMADVVTATKITLKADLNSNSATVDIFPLGTENYTIYATPELPDNWLECDGQTVSDADSPFNGVAIPTMNGTTDATKAYIRGVSGGTTDLVITAPLHSHTFNDNANYAAGGGGGSSGPRTTSADYSIAPYLEMVWIIRIK